MSRSIGSIPWLRPDPNTGWMATPPMKGVASAFCTTAPMSPSFTPSAAVITSVVKMPASLSRAIADSLNRVRSAPRWKVDAATEGPSY